MKKSADVDLIYRELSQKYGQLMTPKDVKKELSVATNRAAKSLVPAGWIGSRKGLRMNTFCFAQQVAELK